MKEEYIESLAFWTTGEDFTRLLRDMWLSGNVYNAIEAMIGQLPLEVVEKVLTGQMKFEGDTRQGNLEVVDDNTPELFGMKLPTIKEALIAKEEALFTSIEYIRLHYVPYYQAYRNPDNDTRVDGEHLGDLIRTYAKEADKLLVEIKYLSTVLGFNAADTEDNKYLNMVGENLILQRNAARRDAAEEHQELIRQVEAANKEADRKISAMLQSGATTALMLANQDLDVLPDLDWYVEGHDFSAIKPESIKETEFNSGYIDRKGRFYSCPDQGHIALGDEMHEQGIIDAEEFRKFTEGLERKGYADPEKFLDKKGWVKLSMGRFFFFPGKLTMRWTKSQINAALDYIAARGFLSDKYRTLDNYDLAHAVLPAIGKANAEVVSCEITENRLYIKAIIPGIEETILPEGAEIGKGHDSYDVVQPGIVIQNSEIGLGALMIAPAIHTVACTNLAVFRKDSLRRMHLGKSLGSDDGLYEYFTDETRELTDQAIWSQVADISREALAGELFRNLVERLRVARGLNITQNPVRVVEVMAKDKSLVDSDKDGILNHLIRGGDLTAYGLHSAITRHSQDVEDYEHASDLEELGGGIIELPRQSLVALINPN